MLLYIHGFNSSPQSHKARLLQDWLAHHYPEMPCEIPYLRPYPAEAVTQLEALVERYRCRGEPVGLVGSSLGGYYAAWLAEKYGLRAVLVNPSVRPFELLGRYIGENKNFHNDERYVFEQKHVEELRTFYVAVHRHPERLWLMVQTGDETLDFKEATAHYLPCRSLIEYGGDHGFQGFERWLPAILAFLQAP